MTNQYDFLKGDWYIRNNNHAVWPLLKTQHIHLNSLRRCIHHAEMMQLTGLQKLINMHRCKLTRRSVRKPPRLKHQQSRIRLNLRYHLYRILLIQILAGYL